MLIKEITNHTYWGTDRITREWQKEQVHDFDWDEDHSTVERLLKENNLSTSILRRKNYNIILPSSVPVNRLGIITHMEQTNWC